MKVKTLKVSEFIEKLITDAHKTRAEELNLSAIEIQKQYEAAYPNLPKKDSSTFRHALKAAGLTTTKKTEIQTSLRNNQAQTDIEAYPKVKAYRLGSMRDGVQAAQIEGQIRNLRKLWELMGKTNPDEWNENEVMEAVNRAYPLSLNAENGKMEYAAPSAVKTLLSPLSTMYSGILRKNWSANLCQHKAGELKDFLAFYELDAFLNSITDTSALSYEGWQAMFRAHINLGCREGTNGKTGIIGLLWEDINFQSRRCSMREKGHRGNAGERWNDCPLDLFPYLRGWKFLMKFWEQQGRPKKGNVFPISYNTYNVMFHATLKKAAEKFNIPRLAENSDTLRLHINRRTHGQYCRRLGIPLEYICGDAPFGRYGVGWKDPKIPVKYYLTLESEYIDSRELEFMQSHTEYSQVLAAMNETNEKQKKWLGVS